MHKMIIVKARGDTVEDAKSNVSSIMDNYIGDGKIFDYYGDIELITMTHWTIKEFKLKKIKDIDKKVKECYKKELEKEWKLLIKEFVEKHYTKHMTLEQAPCFINTDGLKNVAEDVLKRKKTLEQYIMPKTFEEMLETFISYIKEDLQSFIYRAKEIEDLKSLYEYSDYSYELSSTNAHFADITCNTEGNNVYYFCVDRHF